MVPLVTNAVQVGGPITLMTPSRTTGLNGYYSKIIKTHFYPHAHMHTHSCAHKDFTTYLNSETVVNVQ